MVEPSLKPGVWVKAQLRLCDLKTIPAFVTRRGDDDVGTVLLKLNRMDGTAEVLTQVRDMDGKRAWMRGTGYGPVAEAEADAYIARQLGRDPDQWVVEIEDAKGEYELDGSLI